MEPRYGNEQGLIINGHEKYFWGDKNVLKVVYGDDYSTNDGKVAKKININLKWVDSKIRKIHFNTAAYKKKKK